MVAGDASGALSCFDEEIAAAAGGHVYGSEFAVNAHVAAGFTHLLLENHAVAAEAFAKALAQSPGHPKATVGAYAMARRSGDHAAIDRAGAMTASAIDELMRAERQVEAALVTAGWIIPVDLMLAAIRENPGKQALFSKLAARAS